MIQTLRRAGGSLVMTIPKSFTDQNDLAEGSKVELQLLGNQMTIKAPARTHYKLADLMAEMPDTLPMAEGWEDMRPVGQEIP